MKKKIIIIALAIFMLGFGIFIFFKCSNTLKLKDSNFIFEFGEEVPFNVEYYLSKSNENIKTNSKIKFKNEYLVNTDNGIIKSDDSNYLNIGEYELYIEYKGKKYYFNIEVKDTTKPEFKNFKKEIILEQNSVDVDLSKFYEATDLSNTTIVVESDLDISKIGEYKAIVRATDYFDNYIEQESIIKVISHDEINNQKPTENIENVVYKSQKTIDEEKQAKEESLKKEVTSKNENKNTNNNTTNKNNSNTNQSNTSSVTSATYRKDISDNIVIKINNYRKANGLPELPVTSDAQAVADRRAKEIVSNPSHDGSVYGYGENIGGGGIGTDFFELWKNSFAHNNTLLREQNTSIAVSIYQVNNQWFAVAVFKLDY